MMANMSIVDFLEKTASSEPVPGGGSIAALSAAVAASLSEMVANLTTGRKAYADVEEEMNQVRKDILQYKNKLLQDIDDDSEAYRQVMAAFKLPKDTEAEKEHRAQAIQDKLKHAARVPLSVAEDAFKIIDLAGKVVEKGNKNAVTDGAVAAMMARTAVLSALYNVKINLSSIEDTQFVDEITLQVKFMEVRVREKEREVLEKVNL
ncbi:MAG: cyclodeaminase/cyclohydrolase family protein [Deltaproteobacteria bacterium]|nr:cyclodeaminase/cyclohydrolase family protein [Deltaproteobacteria bacterium]